MKDDETEVVPFTPPHKLTPMGRDEFAFAFQLANSAGGMVMPVENPEQFRVNLVDEELDEVTSLRFTDTPINRAMFALKKHFGNDTESFVNCTMRFFAMFSVMRSNEVEKWTKADKSDPRITLLHPAVIYAGAEARLDKNGELDIAKFFELVEKIAPEVNEDEL